MESALVFAAVPTGFFRHGPIVLVLAALWLGGCASVYEVRVDAMSRVSGVSPGGTSFAIIDRAGTGNGSLRQNEIAGLMRTALSAHGLYEASVDKAEMIVEISYGMDPEKRTETIYQEIVFGRPTLPSERIGQPPEGVARAMIGYEQMVSTEVSRLKHISICARANRAETDESPSPDVWRVHVSIENESADLRGHLPILISGAMDFIGRTSDGEITFTLRSDDEAIRFVEKGM